MTRSKVERYSAYYPERYIYRAARALCAIGGWIFLLVPVILLCIVDGTAKMLGIIGAFVTAFLLLLAIGTNAKNWEILSCCAACVFQPDKPRTATYSLVTIGMPRFWLYSWAVSRKKDR